MRGPPISYHRSESVIAVDEHDKIINHNMLRADLDRDPNSTYRRVSAVFLYSRQGWVTAVRARKQALALWEMPFITEHARGNKCLDEIETYRDAATEGLVSELGINLHDINKNSLLYLGMRFPLDLRGFKREYPALLSRAMIAMYAFRISVPIKDLNINKEEIDCLQGGYACPDILTQDMFRNETSFSNFFSFFGIGNENPADVKKRDDMETRLIMVEEYYNGLKPLETVKYAEPQQHTRVDEEFGFALCAYPAWKKR